RAKDDVPDRPITRRSVWSSNCTHGQAWKAIDSGWSSSVCSSSAVSFSPSRADDLPRGRLGTERRMGLYETKSRVAEALVESIFRRARYELSSCRLGSASPLRFGREDFSPNFSVAAPDATEGGEFLVVVKYRPYIDQFIALENKRGPSSVFMLARRHW